MTNIVCFLLFFCSRKVKYMGKKIIKKYKQTKIKQDLNRQTLSSFGESDGALCVQNCNATITKKKFCPPVIADAYHPIFVGDKHSHINTVATSFQFVYQNWFSYISLFSRTNWLDFSSHVTWSSRDHQSSVKENNNDTF